MNREYICPFSDDIRLPEVHLTLSERENKTVKCWNSGELIDIGNKKLFHPYDYIIEDYDVDDVYYTLWCVDKQGTNGVYKSKNDAITAIKSNIHIGSDKRRTLKLFNKHTETIPPVSAIEYSEIIEKVKIPLDEDKSVTVWGILPDGNWEKYYIPTSKKSLINDKIVPIVALGDLTNTAHTESFVEDGSGPVGGMTEAEMVRKMVYLNRNRNNAYKIVRDVSLSGDKDKLDWEPHEIYDLLWYDDREKDLQYKKMKNVKVATGGAERLIKLKYYKPYLTNLTETDPRYTFYLFWNVSSAVINEPAARILTLTNSLTSPKITSRVTSSGKTVHGVDKHLPYPSGTAILALYDNECNGFVNLTKEAVKKNMDMMELNEIQRPCYSSKILNHYQIYEYTNPQALNDDEFIKDLYRDCCNLFSRDKRVLNKIKKVTNFEKDTDAKYPIGEYYDVTTPIASMFGSMFLLKYDPKSLVFKQNDEAMNQEIVRSRLNKGNKNKYKFPGIKDLLGNGNLINNNNNNIVLPSRENGKQLDQVKVSSKKNIEVAINDGNTTASNTRMKTRSSKRKRNGIDDVKDGSPPKKRRKKKVVSN